MSSELTTMAETLREVPLVDLKPGIMYKIMPKGTPNPDEYSIGTYDRKSAEPNVIIIKAMNYFKDISTRIYKNGEDMYLINVSEYTFFEIGPDVHYNPNPSFFKQESASLGGKRKIKRKTKRRVKSKRRSALGY